MLCEEWASEQGMDSLLQLFLLCSYSAVTLVLLLLKLLHKNGFRQFPRVSDLRTSQTDSSPGKNLKCLNT